MKTLLYYSQINREAFPLKATDYTLSLCKKILTIGHGKEAVILKVMSITEKNIIVKA